MDRSAALEWILAQGSAVRAGRFAEGTVLPRDPEAALITVSGLTLTREEWEALDDESVTLLIEALAQEMGTTPPRRAQ